MAPKFSSNSEDQNIRYQLFDMADSLRKSSVSSYSNKSYQRIHKFKFTNLSLSYQIRRQVYEILISFDDNRNFELEKEEITRALVEILDESQEELAYVTRNVYRYDTNQDGIITYEEFTNFCVEQHFGEMAIQRLHREGAYKRGGDRIMSRSEFKRTLQYCFSFIQIKPLDSDLDQIFSDVDLDSDGEITYSDYFLLLREYFGSQSESVNQLTLLEVDSSIDDRRKKELQENRRLHLEQKRLKAEEEARKRQELEDQRRRQNIKTKGEQEKRRLDEEAKRKALEEERRRLELENQRKREKQESERRRQKQQEDQRARQEQLERQRRAKNIDEKLIEGDAQRICRFVFHQLKILLIEKDSELRLSTSRANALQVLTQKLGMKETEANQLIEREFVGRDSIEYESFINSALVTYMCELVPPRIRYPLGRERFVQQVVKSLSFLEARPFESSLLQVFQKTGVQTLDQQAFERVMRLIFSGYRWPRKTGQPRSSIRGPVYAPKNRFF